jgi:hypothetical protein
MTMKLSFPMILASALAGALLMPMFAFAGTSVKVDAAASTTPAQRTCMQSATSVKADANIAALDTLFASFRSAFVTRKNATVSAWGNADGAARAQAIVSANTAFATSVKSAWKAFRDSRASAQATYETSVKNCDIAKTSSNSGKSDKREKHDDDKRSGIWSKLHLNFGLFR